MSAKLISVIGPPASGKTTLAEYLATELPAGMIKEDYYDNPFLEESYVGADDARLPGQLHFLFSRIRQLAETNWPAAGLFVSDYGFCQDRIFARLRLSEADFDIYRRIADRTPSLVHSPQVLICLDAAADSLMARIAERARGYERAFTPELLAEMRNEYNQVESWADCPVICIDTDAVDIRDASKRAKLICRIREAL
jgi:deoxyguanosine kinase